MVSGEARVAETGEFGRVQGLRWGEAGKGWRGVQDQSRKNFWSPVEELALTGDHGRVCGGE